MRYKLLAILLFLTTPALANPLRAAVAEGVRSMAWKIETEGVSMCCCGGEGWSSHDDRYRIEHRDILLVAHLDGGRVRKLRMMEPNCPVKVDRFVPVTNDASLDFLIEELRHSDRGEKLVAAIAMHDHPRTVTELIQLARHDDEKDVRRQAIFWLGQRAGEKAAAELRRFVDEDPDDDVRQHAVFAISQLPRERSVPILIELVKTHKRPGVRKKAMFWLAQTGDPRALDLIEEILGVR
jgi:hypothetical protein